MSVLGITQISLDGVNERISGKPTIRFGGLMYTAKVDESGTVHKQASYMETTISYNRFITEADDPAEFQLRNEFTLVITFDTGQVYQGTGAFVSGDGNQVDSGEGTQAVTISCGRLVKIG